MVFNKPYCDYRSILKELLAPLHVMIECLKSPYYESLSQLDKLFAFLQYYAFRGEL
jgi:hypothetical protein